MTPAYTACLQLGKCEWIQGKQRLSEKYTRLDMPNIYKVDDVGSKVREGGTKTIAINGT